MADNRFGSIELRDLKNRRLTYVGTLKKNKREIPQIFIFWHDGLLYKLKKFLHPVFFLIIKSYLSDRHFSTRIGDTLSSIAKISAGVP